MAESTLLLLTVFGFVVIFLLAMVVTLAFRHAGRLDRAGTDDSSHYSGWEFLLMYITRPLIVLGATYLVSWLLNQYPDMFGRWQPDSQYLWAWYLFWIFLLLFNLNEAVGRMLVLSRNRHIFTFRVISMLVRLILVGGSAFVVFHLVLDFDTSKLFTSTAVVAAVLGIALREVLSNYLSGMSLNLAGTVEANQWISIGDKEGEVIQRNWRETRIRSTSGHIYIIPNSTVANSVINHLTWGTPLRRHHLHVTVSFEASPHLVQRSLVQAALSVPEVDRDFKQPDAYINEFKDYGMVFRLRFWSRTYHDRTRLEGEVLRRVWYQLHRHGVTIPFSAGGLLQVRGGEPLAPNALFQTSAEKLWKLHQCGFVQQYLIQKDGTTWVSEAELLAFAEGLSVMLFGIDEIVFQQGTLGENCYVVVRGHLQGRIELGIEGKFSEFSLHAGQLMGEMTLLTGLPRTATIIARDEVELLEISGPMFTRLLAMHVEIPQNFASIMARRSKEMMDGLQDVVHHPATQDSSHLFTILSSQLGNLQPQREKALPPATPGSGTDT